MNRLLLTLAALLIAVPAALRAQASDRALRWDPGYDPPRTVFGHPDLQGNWTNVTLTPFERAPSQEPVYFVGRGATNRAGQRGLPAESRDGDVRPHAGLGVEQRGPTAGQRVQRSLLGSRSMVAVVDGEPRTSLVTMPPDGRVPELTPTAERVQADRTAFRSQFEQYDHPELRPLGERCIVSFGSSAGPPMTPNSAYNNKLHDCPDSGPRALHGGDGPRLPRRPPGRAPASPGRRQPYFGHSWGRWEGNTLVVETTGINPDHPFRGVPTPQKGG